MFPMGALNLVALFIKSYEQTYIYLSSYLFILKHVYTYLRYFKNKIALTIQSS